jgi:hypothetical protein
MSDNPFTTTYKSLSTDKLLDIIENSGDYQAVAVEAAQLEIESRKLSQEQLAEARALQTVRQTERAKKQERSEALENKLKTFGTSIAGTLNPIKPEPPTTRRHINLILLIITALLLYHLYNYFGLLKYMLTNEEAEWDLSMIYLFSALPILAVIITLFWQRKRSGWILATVYFSYKTSETIAGVIIALIYYTGADRESFLPMASPLQLGTILLFGGLTWTLCRANIREAYKIQKQSMIISLSIGAGFVALVLGFVFILT